MVWNSPTGLFEVGGSKILVGPAGRADIQGLIRLPAEYASISEYAVAFAIEVKTGKGELKKNQRTWRDRFVELGGLYMVAREILSVEYVFSSNNIAEALRRSSAFHK